MQRQFYDLAHEVDCFYEDRQNYPCVYADNKHHIVVVVDKCGHLNGGSWEVVSDNITDNVADIKYHVSPLTKVICHHQWVTADSISDTEHQYFCAYCGEKKAEAFGAKHESN